MNYIVSGLFGCILDLFESDWRHFVLFRFLVGMLWDFYSITYIVPYISILFLSILFVSVRFGFFHSQLSFINFCPYCLVVHFGLHLLVSLSI